MRSLPLTITKTTKDNIRLPVPTVCRYCYDVLSKYCTGSVHILVGYRCSRYGLGQANSTEVYCSFNRKFAAVSTFGQKQVLPVHQVPYLNFITKSFAPNAFTAFARVCRISSLDHKTLEHKS
jgi:hypothetical protein